MIQWAKNKLQQGKSKAVYIAMTAALALTALPVGASATTPPSTAVDFSTTTGLQVTATDVISTGFSFMNQFGTWTNIVLGIIFAPVAVGFVIWLFRKLPKLGK